MRQRPLQFGLYIVLVLLVPAISSDGAEWTIPHRPEPRDEDWVLIVNDVSKAFPTPGYRNFGG